MKPNSIKQICIVHQIRTSLKYVSYKDRKNVVKDIKSIYQADNEQLVLESLEIFRANWNNKYPLAIRSWENNWTNLSTFLNYPEEIRKVIYTTNIIESFNANLRRYTKNKKVFPTDNAALKSIYLCKAKCIKEMEKTRFNWGQIYNQFYIYFPTRIK